MDVESILAEPRRHEDPKALAGMARYGIRTRRALGVRLHKRALTLARTLTNSDSAPGRRVGRVAAKELESPAVVRRVSSSRRRPNP